MRYINSTHPEKYVGRPGDGKAYTWIDSVELGTYTVVLNINIQTTESYVSHQRIVIEDATIMQILPALLNGEVSCYEVLVGLEAFLSSQIAKKSFYTVDETNEKSRLGSLCFDLQDQNHPLALLCLFSPHHFDDRRSNINTIRTKVIDDEIYVALKAIDVSVFKKTNIIPSIVVLEDLPKSHVSVKSAAVGSTQSEIDVLVDRAENDSGALIVQTNAPHATIQKLNSAYPKDHADRAIPWYNITRKDPVLSSWNPSKVIIGSDYSVSLPDGFKQTKGWEQTVYSEKDPNQCDALASAFYSAIPGIEKILNKQLTGAHQINIGVALYYPQAKYMSGPWHKDGRSYITSIVYFHHKNVNAELSFRYPSSEQKLTSVPINTGDIVTFANEVLEHRIENVFSGHGGIRGLVTFFYQGPHGVPASLKEKTLSSPPVIEECIDEQTKAWRI